MATLADSNKDLKADQDLAIQVSKGELSALVENNDPEDRQRVKELVKQIDMKDTTSIISFGVGTQNGLTEKSSNMLRGVRNKDTGHAGGIMNNLMVQVRSLGVNDLKPGQKQNFINKMLGRLTPVQKFVQQYESIQGQINATIEKLEDEKRKLGRDVLLLDGMYDEALDFFNELAYYIEAGEIKLKEVREIEIPALKSEAEKTNDMVKTQELRDLTERANDLERRVHDLKLTRQITMQMLPQLRMIQDVDKGLITKIQSSILTTVPLWQNQIAMAIALWNQAEAIKHQRAVTDATNEMYQKNSELLRQNSAEARKEIERGVVDIEAIKKVNGDLIATINEAVQIAEEGQKARLAANSEMIKCEAELKIALYGLNKAAQE